jgi:prepilin-type N-terminal cleavage/methylation domain-containing protein
VKYPKKGIKGVTLFEVLLVLAVAAVIAAMAWPALRRPLARYRLYSAADKVRTQWCQDRVEAMRSGRTYVFRYVVGGNQFRSGPEEGTSAAASDGSDMIGDGRQRGDGTLPEGVKFLADAPALPANRQAAAPDESGDSWSDPILFYPDGTTSDARLLLAGDQSCAVRLMLRGLTGAPSVSDPDAIEDPPP